MNGITSHHGHHSAEQHVHDIRDQGRLAINVRDKQNLL